MEVKTLTSETTIKLASTVAAIQIDADLYVVKRSQSLASKKTSGEFVASVPFSKAGSTSQGFLKTRAYQRLLKGADPSYEQLSILPADALDKVLKKGFRSDAAWDVSRTPFDDIEADPTAVERIVRVATDRHMVFDRFGVPLPLVVEFDYINGKIANDRYDLQKTAEHLLSRDDVQVYPSTGWGDRFDRDAKATTVEECIAAIPYYNAERGRNRTITFAWYPTRDAYIRMWEACQTVEPRYPSVAMQEAVFNLDLLGLRACGAALCDTYWAKTVRDEDEREEEEDD